MGLFKKKSVLSFTKDLINNKIGLPMSADLINSRIERLEQIESLYNKMISEIDMELEKDFSIKTAFNWKKIDGSNISETNNINLVKTQMLQKHLSAEELTNSKIRYLAALESARTYFIDKIAASDIRIKHLNSLKLEDVFGDLDALVLIYDGKDFMINYKNIDDVVASLKYSSEARIAFDNSKKIK